MSGLRDQLAPPPPPAVEVSVVIAAYQAHSTLAEQLDALAAQRVPFRWEVVVADNGSTDGTVALARTYADRLPGLRVVDASARRGAGAARNIGVAAARGRSVVFCDADDVVADGWLAAMHAALQQHAFVAGAFEGQRLNDAAALRSRVLPQQDGLQESGHLPGVRHAGAGTLGVHRDVFRAVGGLDTDLCWRIQLAGVPLVWLPTAVVHVRLRGGLRASARQGYSYGTGERWLALRYREVQTRLVSLASHVGAVGAGVLVGEAVPGRAGRAASRNGAGPHGSRIGRMLHRARLSAAELLRVSSRGELAAWCWDVAWGIGFAFGHVDLPAPISVQPVDRTTLAA
jgi:hypothetical protein